MKLSREKQFTIARARIIHSFRIIHHRYATVFIVLSLSLQVFCSSTSSSRGFGCNQEPRNSLGRDGLIDKNPQASWPIASPHPSLFDENLSQLAKLNVQQQLQQNASSSPIESDTNHIITQTRETTTRPSKKHSEQQRQSQSNETLLQSKPASMLISGLINAKVSLPCDISPPTQDDSVALILWYKDDSVAPIYTLDARKEPHLERARATIDEAYSNRASFSHSGRPAHLQLEQLKLDDEGDYRCRVDFRRGRTVNTIISLRIIIPPEDVRIVSPSKPAQRLEGHIGPLSEGQELVLLCVAQGGKPRPHLSWRHDFAVIDETFQRLDKDGTSNELRIPALTRSHLLSKFICQANNSQPINTEITLDLNLKPQEIVVRQAAGAQEPLVVGQNATFECLSSGSRPQATIYWLFQGLRHQPPTEFLQQQSLSRLTLTLQRSFNGQALTCVAENERLGGQSTSANGTPIASSIKQTLKLDVQYAPQLSIRLEGGQASGGGNNEQAATGAAGDSTQSPVETPRSTVQQQRQKWSPQQGNDIYLTCQMDANPRPQKPILWRHNGRLLTNSNSVQQQHQSQHATIVINNQSLVLRKINPNQSGAYTCESSNSLGTNSSLPLELNVRHAPVCATDDILIYEAVIGQTISIDCQVVANPPKSVHFSWFKSTLEPNLTDWVQRDASLDEQIDESSQLLKIKIKDRKQFDQFKCKAKNEIGLQQRPCLFQLIEARVPKLRHSCRQASSASANSISVACEPTDHLKSDEFELSGLNININNNNNNNNLKDDQQQQRMSSKLMGSYWPLGLAGKTGSQSAAATSTTSQPSTFGLADETLQLPLRARLVHPPRWLLVEVYKVSPSNESELMSYVIVGSPSQLTTIKSLVETNQVFRANPKGTYYVMTRPPINGDEVAPSSSTSNNSDIKSSDQHSQNAKFFQQQQGQHRRILEDGLVFLEDPSIELASSFRFNIPNLEPESRYKLMIFGQNVGAKTRDWIALRVDTPGAEPLESRSRTLINPELNSSNETLSADQMGQADDKSTSHQAQKSLVMRSDYPASDTNNAISNHDNSPDLSDGDPQTHQQQQSSSSLLNNKSQAHFGSRFLDVAARNWPLVQSQMGLYADKALVFARQRPLLAVPVAIITSICLLFTLILLINQLTRRADKSQQQGQEQQHQTNPEGQEKRRPSDNLDNLDDDYSARSSNQSTRKSPPDLSPKMRLLDAAGQRGHLSNLNPNQIMSTSNSGGSSSSGSQQGNGLIGATRLASHNHHSSERDQHEQQVFAICSSPLSNSPANSVFPSSLYGYNKTCDQQEIVLANEIIDNSGAFLNWVAQDQQLYNPSGGRALVGSLDRRSSILFNHEQPIYLRTLIGDAGDSNLIMVNGFNSIDRSNHQKIQNNHRNQRLQEAIQARNKQEQQQYHGKANQRVAFDLSPYEGRNGANNESQRCQSKQQQQQQRQQIGTVRQHSQPAEATLINKATSDSSGSNSNQAADSGHESPPTNPNLSTETTTTTTLTNHGIIHVDSSLMSNNICGDTNGHISAFADSLDCATSNSNGLMSRDAFNLLANSERQQNQHQVGQGDVIAIGTASSLGSSIGCSPAISEQLMSPNSGQAGGLLMLVQDDQPSLHKKNQITSLSFHGNKNINRSSGNNGPSKNCVPSQIELPLSHGNDGNIYHIQNHHQSGDSSERNNQHNYQHRPRLRSNNRLRDKDNSKSMLRDPYLNDSSELQDMENWL